MSEPYADPPRSRPLWRSFLAGLLLLVAVVLAPVAVVSGWAKAHVVSTQGFVDTFGPLAERPEVQQSVTSKTVAAMRDQLSSAGLPDSVAAGIGSALSRPVEQFVASSAFQDLWDQSLRSLHTQIADQAEGSADSGVAVDSSGQVTIQLKPVIVAVKADLVDRGTPLASRIPETDRTVVVATIRDTSRIQEGYRLADTLGTWTPPIAVGCLVLGLVVANRRRRSLAVTGVLVALGMGLTWLAVQGGREVAVNRLSGHFTADTVHALWDGSVDSLDRTIVIVGAAALVVAVLAGVAGLFGRRD